jgi:hypothetical protein
VDGVVDVVPPVVVVEVVVDVAAAGVAKKTFAERVAPSVPSGGVLLVGIVGTVQPVPPPVPLVPTGHIDQPLTSSARGSRSSDWKNDSRFGYEPVTPIDTGSSVSVLAAEAATLVLPGVVPLEDGAASAVAAPGVMLIRSTPAPLAAAES